MLLLQEEPQQPAGQWLVKVRDQVAVLQGRRNNTQSMKLDNNNNK
jgi:hypothetical protein